MEKKGSVRTGFFSGLMLMLCGGAIAGVGFNVAFGAWAFSGEGILGGLISGFLIYTIS